MKKGEKENFPSRKASEYLEKKKLRVHRNTGIEHHITNRHEKQWEKSTLKKKWEKSTLKKKWEKSTFKKKEKAVRLRKSEKKVR